MAVKYFTKLLEAVAIVIVTQKRVEQFLWNNIACRFGVPNTLVMDNDLQLRGDHMKPFYYSLNIRMTPSLVAHPQKKVQIEAINGVILTAMKKRLGDVKEA